MPEVTGNSFFFVNIRRSLPRWSVHRLSQWVSHGQACPGHWIAGGNLMSSFNRESRFVAVNIAMP